MLVLKTECKSAIRDGFSSNKSENNLKNPLSWTKPFQNLNQDIISLDVEKAVVPAPKDAELVYNAILNVLPVVAVKL